MSEAKKNSCKWNIYFCEIGGMIKLEDANDFSTIEIDKIFDQLANELKLKSSVSENENSNIKDKQR